MKASHQNTHSAFSEFNSLPFRLPKVIFSFSLSLLKLSYIFKPHQLPHLDLGTLASSVGINVSYDAVRFSGTRKTNVVFSQL